MSTSVFPDLPGIDIAVEREAIYKTTIHETASGKEDRASWQSTPRYRYKLTYNLVRDNVAAPAPYAAYSEAGVVFQFLSSSAGAWDSFVFPDPYSGTNTQVRFVEDSVTVTKIADHFWSVSFSLISVK
jgi:hypothetical protein